MVSIKIECYNEAVVGLVVDDGVGHCGVQLLEWLNK